MEILQLLLLCGVVASPLFIAIFIIEGMLRSDYDPIRQPVSALSLGARGWVQKANFIVTGILLLASARGLLFVLQPYNASFWGPLLISIYGLGLIGAGIFNTDNTGIQNMTPRPLKRRADAISHDLFSLIVFSSLFAASFVFHNIFASNGEYGWAIYCALSGIFGVIGFLLFARAFVTKGKLSSVAGLLQRLTIVISGLSISFVVAHLAGWL